MSMYIIVTRRGESGSLEIVKDEGNNLSTLYNKKELEQGLEEAGNKHGINNILCFKQVTVRTKTEITYIEE